MGAWAWFTGTSVEGRIVRKLHPLILFDIIIKLAINPKELVEKMMHDMPCFHIMDEVFALYRGEEG